MFTAINLARQQDGHLPLVRVGPRQRYSIHEQLDLRCVGTCRQSHLNRLASRADPEFVVEFARAAKEAGADRLRYCDTVGILDPFRIYERTKMLMDEVDIPIEMHTHNDFGMATANAIAGLKAGATYVSIFFGRIKDMGYDPRDVIADTREMIDREGLKAQIITGSIRHLMDVNESFLAGAHIVTITPPILKKMTWNPRSETTIEEFNSIWREMKEKGQI